VTAIVDAYLDWCQKHRAADTYEWYRYPTAQRYCHECGGQLNGTETFCPACGQRLASEQPG
jgi:hypothetical protein